MKMFRRDEVFTLVELMVVVLIIGILVAIAFSVFFAAKVNAQRKSCYANQRTIEGAANAYLAEANSYPGTVAVLESSGYLKSLPRCPVAGNGTTSTYAFGTLAAENSATDSANGTSTVRPCTYPVAPSTPHGAYQQ